LAPSFDPARYNLALVLYRQQKAGEALPHLDRLRSSDPRDPTYRNLRAACLGLIGEYAQAIAVYRGLLDDFPGQARIWLSLGHALRTSGQRAESVAAYRRRG
jgi:predicted Zn-dependent protease